MGERSHLSQHRKVVYLRHAKFYHPKQHHLFDALWRNMQSSFINYMRLKRMKQDHIIHCACSQHKAP